MVTQLLGHLAADEHRVGAAAEVAQHLELVLDLRAAGDQHERPLHLAEQLAELLQLALEQQARVGRKQLRDPDRGRVRPVDRAESVLDEQVTPLGELARELRVVLRLAGVEARVLEDVDPLVRKQLAQPPRHGRHRQGGVRPFRAAQVRADRHLRRVVLEQVLERRQRLADPVVVSDAAVLERHVQVGADQHVLAAHVGLPDGARPVQRPRLKPRPAASPRPSRRGLRAGTSSPTRCRTSRRP